MSEPQQICATDKEIFDVLMGAKKQYSVHSLLGIAKQRGIFYSNADSREALASNISLLPFSYRNLQELLDVREISSRIERVTHVSVPVAVKIDDIKKVSLQYKDEAAASEKIECIPQGVKGYKVTVKYDEIDYSKTRLIQRREKEADIEFLVEDNATLIRMPANDKAISIAEKLKERIIQSLPVKPPTNVISLEDVADPLLRSSFFTNLISRIEGFALRTVTSLKVEKQDTGAVTARPARTLRHPGNLGRLAPGPHS